MSGIAGILRLDGATPDPARLDAMLAHLRHRGPEGERAGAFGPCALGATSLEIIGRQPPFSGDAAASGNDGSVRTGNPGGTFGRVSGGASGGTENNPVAQGKFFGGVEKHPIAREKTSGGGGGRPLSISVAGEHHDGKCHTLGPLHLVFNGEIYNHHDLRAKLVKRGHRFQSPRADAEVLLLGYRQWGTRLGRHIKGMYAFAIWDEQHQELFVCGDRPGIKPLHVYRSDTEVIFASLPGAILAALPPDRRPDLDRAALATFLRYGFPFADTLDTGVMALPPACWMSFQSGGDFKMRAYWQPPPVSRSSTALGVRDAIREVISESVDLHLESDVPIGCLLSGGINSSIIAALAQRKLDRDGAGPLQTFSIAIPGLAYDESQHAQAVADHIGSHHHRVTVDLGHILDDLRRMVELYGVPTADQSLLSTYWACRAARQHIAVALTGIGGDELFGGHRRYLRMRPAFWARLGQTLGRAPLPPAHRYLQMIRVFDDPMLRALGMDPPARDGGDGIDEWIDEPDPIHAAMRWDLNHTLPFRVLRRADRTSMAVALELRAPLLTASVLDLAGHLPPSVLMTGHRPSAMLRQVAAELLPAGLVTRPRQTFPAPFTDWFRSALRDDVHDLLTGPALERLGIDPAAAGRLLAEHATGRVDHAARILALLTLIFWDESHPPPPPPSLAHP